MRFPYIRVKINVYNVYILIKCSIYKGFGVYVYVYVLQNLYTFRSETYTFPVLVRAISRSYSIFNLHPCNTSPTVLVWFCMSFSSLYQGVFHES